MRTFPHILSVLCLSLPLVAHAQARSLAPDSSFSLVLPEGAVRTTSDPLALGPGSVTFDMPTRAGHGTLALLGLKPLPYGYNAPMLFADSVRLARAPLDPDARVSALQGDKESNPLSIGIAYFWNGYCGDCDLTEVTVVGGNHALLVVYSYDDTREVARQFGQQQLWTALKSFRWER